MTATRLVVAGCSNGSGDSGASGSSSGSGSVIDANAGDTGAGADGTGSSDAGAPTDATVNGDSPTEAGSGPVPPSPAAAAGYTVNTFNSTFDKAKIDLASTYDSGFPWYLGAYWSKVKSPASALTFNADGSMTMNNGGSLNSAAPSAEQGKKWVGTAFGGGAYFEATLHFDPQDTIEGSAGSGWPAWWGEPIEHLASLPAVYWPGQGNGYVHYVETDFLEYNIWSWTPHYEYSGSMLDGYGASGSDACPHYCLVQNSGGGGTNYSNRQVQSPKSTDFTKYHQFGFLWIPATETTSGSAQFFFDRVGTNDKVTWTKYQGDAVAPPPGTTPWTFGVLGQQHQILLINTGTAEPMVVESVQVWQASDKDNLVQ